MALGYKADVIKKYFLNNNQVSSDFTIDLKDSSLRVKAEKDSEVEKEFVHQGIAARSFERVFV